MNDQPNPVTKILNAYTHAVSTRDVDAFMALYVPAIHQFDAWDQFEQFGADAWREAVTDWFGSHPDEVFEMQFDDVHAIVGDDVAFVHTVATFTVITNGTPTHKQVNRYTAGLAKRNGAWKIVHEHTSIPAAYESGMSAVPQ